MSKIFWPEPPATLDNVRRDLVTVTVLLGDIKEALVTISFTLLRIEQQQRKRWWQF